MNEHKTSSSKMLLVVTSWFLRKKIIFVRKKTPLSVSDISETYNRDDNILELYFTKFYRVASLVALENLENFRKILKPHGIIA